MEYLSPFVGQADLRAVNFRSRCVTVCLSAGAEAER